ncbi:MAG: hypothetical protein O3C51_17805 [Planctomycetota bacterium]|nr:hypothetical protein [Planctomycetota bacterium]
MTCQSCGRAFVPSSVSTRSARKQNNAQPFILGGALLAFMIIGLVLISGGGKEPVQQTQEPVRTVETGMKNSRVRDVAEWAEALASGNRFKLSSTTDVGAFVGFFEIGLVDGTASDRERLVLDRLLEDPKTAVLRDSYVGFGKIDKDAAEADRGTVRLDLSIKEDAQKRWSQPTATYDVSFAVQGGRAKVTGFSAIYEPPPRAEPKARGPRPAKHEVIGDAASVERDYGGVKTTVREAELKPLPHMDGTSPDVQQKIDALIATLVDLEGSGGAANTASRRLKDIGKPAVPRLLNKLYELVVGNTASLQDQHTVLQIRRVTMGLEDVTGQRFGFDPSVLGSQTSSQEYRLSSLRQWYGYWADNHWREDWRLGVDDADDPFAEKTEEPSKRR